MDQAYKQPGHSAAFSGRNQLKRIFPSENVKQYLSSVDSYTRHRQAKKPRFRNPVYVYNTRELIQVDLADVGSLAKFNNNTHYLLLVIDTFSRKAWLRPLTNKSAPVVTSAMESILNEMDGEKVKRLFSDSGKEFTANAFQTLLKKHNIKHTTSTAEVKAPHVERFTGTLKRLMHMYMTENETRKYIDQLDNLLATYNKRFHRSINMSPNEADKPTNRELVIDVLNRKRYGPIAQKRSKSGSEFQVGDIVRLKIHASTFQKGHDETFTGEMFRIKNILDTLPITQYEVETYNGDETIRGSFYSSELQLCTNPVFKIEKIIARRGNKLFVKWLHFDEQYNEWINASDVEEEYDND
jgi:transposase InsO family protein